MIEMMAVVRIECGVGENVGGGGGLSYLFLVRSEAHDAERSRGQLMITLE